MGVLKPINEEVQGPDIAYSSPRSVKVISQTVAVETKQRTELINLTEDLRSFVASANVQEGSLTVSSLHTTAGLFINEWQNALLTDIESALERIVPRSLYYRHNDPELSDCMRKNADSHLRSTIIGLSLSIPISQGNLILGQWQNVILAEFDGPNQRKVFLQVFGV